MTLVKGEVKLVGVATCVKKREAKNTASKQNLAKLFLDCRGMVQVVHAVEEIRERYDSQKVAQLECGGCVFVLNDEERGELPKI